MLFRRLNFNIATPPIVVAVTTTTTTNKTRNSVRYGCPRIFFERIIDQHKSFNVKIGSILDEMMKF